MGITMGIMQLHRQYLLQPLYKNKREVWGEKLNGLLATGKNPPYSEYVSFPTPLKTFP